MHYTRLRQRVALQVLPETRPVKRVALAAPVEPLPDKTDRGIVEASYRARITADTVVTIMSGQFGSQYAPQVFDLHDVPDCLEPCIQLFAFLPELLAARLAANYKIAPATTAAKMGKSK